MILSDKKSSGLDPAVLDHLMTAENRLPKLLTKRKLGKFISAVIGKIPGVSNCLVCIGGVFTPSTQTSEFPCSLCPIDFDAPAPRESGKCKLQKDTDFMSIGLKTTSSFLGFLFIQGAKSEQFAPYYPFVINFCNHIAIHLENRHQRERLRLQNKELKKRHEDLEKLVQLRNRELSESEEKFATAFRNAPLLMSITSLDDGRFLDVNDAFVEITGYPREVAIGSTSVGIGWANSEERNRVFKIIKAQGRARNLEVTVNSANGPQLICLYSGEIIEFGGKKRLLSTANDITEKKLAV